MHSGDYSSRELAAAPNESHARYENSSLRETKSQNIPITNHIQRTESEIKLCEDEALAEYRDHCMYNRIVKGLSRSQDYASNRQVRSLDFLYENGACIANIERNRREHPHKVESLHSRHEKAWKMITGASKTESPKQNAHAIVSHANSFSVPMLQDFDDEDQMFILDP